MKFLVVKAPSYEFCNAFVVESIGWEKEMIPHDVQGTCPDGSTPVVENVSGLECM